MHPDFSAAKIEKKKCANYASKNGVCFSKSYHEAVKESHSLYRFMFSISHMALLLTVGFPRQSYWPNLGRGSSSLKNTALSLWRFQKENTEA
jgi:hypothetical protein